MNDSFKKLTRRDFLRTTGGLALGMAMGLPAFGQETVPSAVKSKVVLIRHPDAVNKDLTVNGPVIQQMLDDAVKTLFGRDDPVACWKQIIKPVDIVGIKSNIWPNLATPPEVEQAIKRRIMDAGVPEKNISIDDQGVLDNPIFKNATALINTRPMRSHAWAGVGSLLKNYIMFAPMPQNYHDDACAYLGAVWKLPIVKDKTRLNVLVMTTPQFHGTGPHHFDPTYVWPYKGLLVGTDPVALDTIGLQIFQARRKAYFGEDRPLKPSAHHIAIADTKYGLGNSDLSKIELIRLGWQEDILI